MRKCLLLALAAFLGSLCTILFVGLLPRVSVGAGGALTDSRFCTDADGNGRLEISDAITILDYLFLGTATPYCIAQDASLEQFATREEMEALRDRVAAVEADIRQGGWIATGAFVGDGTQGRVIDTGVPGAVRSVTLYLQSEAGNYYSNMSEKLDSMPERLSTASPGISLEGNTFVLDARISVGQGFASSDLNIRGRSYTWVAHLAPQ